MSARLSIRSYTRVMHAHRHDYCQLVFPLHGTIQISIDTAAGTDRVQPPSNQVGPGRCAIIPSGATHSFSADEQSSFLVADLDQLPEPMTDLPTFFVSISSPLLTFCQFVECQLQHRHNPVLNEEIGALFLSLLLQERFQARHDPRISRTMEYLQQDLSQTIQLAELAEIACLSLSQYKTLFKQQTGLSTRQYLLKLRMDKARALLAHTDYPISIIAEHVGYQDLSAFSRRFSEYFGQSPKHFRT
ncbi:helix-turn-helix domain-containing protein [Pontibacterium sp.]|uniref:helix-turn-helix domain-containing protein n=1 Tax=Pontibacterium sp. TaxID=2036026 RepID=UPI00356373FA